jgi:hypothetical protein
MVVRDQAAVVERALASFLPVVDHYVIGDAGSRDDTADRITGFFARAGVPGELHRLTPDDTARNRSLDLCRASNGSFDYILLGGADLELVVDDPAAARRLDKPAYLVRRTAGVSHFDPRLIRRDVPARWSAAGQLDLAAPAERLDGLWLKEHPGAPRDLAALRAAVERDPGDAHAIFELAEAHREGRRWRDAIAWYERRLAAGGSDEESWLAACMLAVCHGELGDDAAYVRASLRAFERRPSRAEPLHRLACHYRWREQHDSCAMACEVGLAIPYPDCDRLAIDDAVYAHGLREELAISGYYCADPRLQELGRRTCLELAVDRSVPWWVRKQARENCAYYARPAEELFGEMAVRDVALRVPRPYLPLNPSIAVEGDERRALVRTVNYRTDDSAWVVHDPEWAIRSQNYLCELDVDLGTIAAPAVVDRAAGPPVFDYPVHGFEDGRLFRWRGRWWFSASVRDRHPEGLCDIALCALADSGDVTSVRLLRGSWSALHQKNWVPLVRGDELLFVYAADPTVILRCDDTSIEEIASSVPAAALDHLRGGSQALRIPGGWLYVAHEAVVHDDYHRVYMHRFVGLDEELRVVSLSDPFFFVRRSVEFCAGLARHGGKLVASFGVDDRRACLAWLDEAAVLRALRPL